MGKTLCIVMEEQLVDELRQEGKRVGMGSLSSVIRFASWKWLQEQRREATNAEPTKIMGGVVPVDPGPSGAKSAEALEPSRA